MYVISDGLYILLYYVVGYRKAVVRGNLLIAFPGKNAEERMRIEKDFYHNFLDTMVEIVKLITINEKDFRRRITSNVEVLNSMEGKVNNVAIVSGHFFNWEFGNLAASLESKFPLLSVYMPVKSKAFDKLMYDMRKKFGATMISAADFRAFFKYKDTNYALGLIADQNPSDPRTAYWMSFFNKLTPFLKGPEKTSKRNKSGVVFVNYIKRKRGYYHMSYTHVTTDPAQFAEGALTKELIRLTEKCIIENPANYLWSHRRWKHTFSEEYRHLVIR